MKCFLLTLGAGADLALPRMLTALSCGAARQPEAVSVLRVPTSAAESVAGRLAEDLSFCHDFLALQDAFAFFRTRWTLSCWLPSLPDREALARGQESAVLLSALRGEGVPFSFRTDREAAEWSLAALLESVPPEGSALSEDPAAENLKPLLDFMAGIRSALSEGEQVRLLLMCDLCEGYAAGLAQGLLRFFRQRFPDPSFYLGLIAQVRAQGPDAFSRLGEARDALSALQKRNLVRVSADRETEGADACWLLGLPAALVSGEDSFRLTDWVAARILGEVCTAQVPPAPGLHTRELPGTLTLQALDQETRPAAAFLRGAFWCLSDLFPSLRSYLDHPALLRSLAPASRGGIFRRLFRDQSRPESVLQDLSRLERTLRAQCLEILSLIRTLPPLLREAEPASDLWQQAVQACGRFVTQASEYDVRRKEAEDSGVDRVQPVHRVSLADTEEEELLRKLDTMAEELAALQADRSEVFARSGGALARLALEDCLARCRVAETSAREKLVLMPSGDPEQRLALGLQERRVRLLNAAVLRSRQDLESALRFDALSRPGTFRPLSPFAGELLDPELAEQAFTFLTAEGEAADGAAKAVRDGLDHLLRGYSLNDAKMLLKNLQSVCRQPEAEAPLRSLMAGVFSVCGVEVSGLRFQSRGQLPALALLPDLTEAGRFFSLSSAPDRLIAPPREAPVGRDRGILALLLLREYRRPAPEEASLELLPLTPEDSPLTRVWLSSRGVDRAVLCSLRGGPEEAPLRQPLAILLPGLGLEAVKLRKDALDLIPAFCFWLDRDSLSFRDPCLWLSDGDRAVLTEQLTRLRVSLTESRSLALMNFLADFHQDIMQAPRRLSDTEADSLPERLRVVCGLSRLPVWKKDLHRVSSFYEAGRQGDPVCAALAGADSFEAASCKVREDVTYTFRNIPIAREHPLRLLESTHAPEEAHYLSSLNTECDILRRSSDDYHEALSEGLKSLLLRFPGADPEAVSRAEALLKEAEEPVTDQVTELTWPWDTVSASVQTILSECLGPTLAAAALHPFAERLALFPARGGEILGDRMLSACCLIRRQAAEAAGAGDEAAGSSRTDSPETADVRGDAALPPLDHGFAEAVCRDPRGQSLLGPGFLSMEPAGEGIRVTLTLEGAFTLKLVRVYQPAETLSFYAHDLPTLALWPSLPFPREQWHAYFSYAHCPEEFRVTAVTGSQTEILSGSGARLTAHTDEYPLCYLIHYGDDSLGAVPNLLPPPEIPEGRSLTVCLDFGAAGLSLVLTDGSARWPMQGPVTVRTLLRSPAASEALLWREFLPAVPVTGLLPAALRIFRNDVAEEDLPLRDSAIFMSSSLRDVVEIPSDALYTDLKWTGEKGRGTALCLHQAMLMAALQARCAGAVSLSWRASLPGEMAPEGRSRLAETLQALAGRVSLESGLPLPEKRPPVAFASESAALGAYFRFCAPEETRGGFLTLDLGADTADLSLFLRGREEAVRSVQLPLGIHHMLLPDLLRDPGMLREDFGYLDRPDFQRDLSDLQALLERARRDPAALRHARYGLDAFLADHLPLLAASLRERRAAGSPGRSGSLILLHTAFLMMLSGLLLLQMAGDTQRNDDLPSQIALFLAGRGSLVPEAFSPEAKSSLWRILSMFRNPRVSDLRLIFSGEKKMELSVGLSLLDRPTAALPKPAAVPAAVAVRPEELMPEFLLRFRREYPEEAALLFPGVFANDYVAPFTPYGQQRLGEALQAVFDRREPGRPFPALVSCLSHLLTLIQEGGPLP